MNKSIRAIYRLDNVEKSFYNYCLFYSNDKEDTSFCEDKVFYIGTAKNVKILAQRRERDHIRDAYQKKYWDFHKSRKIRLLESNGCFIMSKVLEEFDTEEESYLGEAKWQTFFIEKSLDLTNMIPCGTKSLSSGENHPSYDPNLRKDKEEIIKLYTIDLWPIQRICRHFKLSQKTVKKILFKESDNIQRKERLTSPLWKFQKEIVEEYNSGELAYKIAKKYNCSLNFIVRLLKVNNVKIRESLALVRTPSDVWKVKKEVVDFYLSGKSLSWLAKNYKCDYKCTLKPILEEAGVLGKRKLKNPKKSFLWDKQEEIKFLRSKGLTFKQISESFEVSEALIQKIFYNEKR